MNANALAWISAREPQGLSSSGAGRVLLSGAFVFSVLIGGSDSGRVDVTARSAAFIVGSAIIVLAVVRLPRRWDLVDVSVLGALLAFLIAALGSGHTRLSFDASTTALAYAGAFFVSRSMTRVHAIRDFAIGLLGLLGTVIAVLHAFAWGAVWLQWTSIPDAGLPPLSLSLPPLLFFPARTAMLVAMLLPAVVLLIRRQRVWPIGLIGTVASIAVILMSGSRAVWLAAVAAFVVTWMLNRGTSRRSLMMAGAAIAAVLLLITVAVSPTLLSRLVAGSSVDLRFAIWTEAVGIWLTSPVAGAGPDSFASTLVATGFYNDFAPYIRHAHSTPVQLLAETGLMGVLASCLLGYAVWTGRKLSGPGSLAAVFAITFFVVAGLTEEPAQVGSVVIVLIVWAAILCPRETEEAPAPRRSWIAPVTLGAATVVGAAQVAILAAAFVHENAAQAANRGEHEAARESLQLAASLDPSLALYHRELGVWQLAAGESELAIAELARAVSLNPADQAALRALAIARASSGDATGAAEAAIAAAGRAVLHPENALTLAFVAAAAGDETSAEEAAAAAVQPNPWILSAPEWDVLPGGMRGAALQIAAQSAGASAPGSRDLRAYSWLHALVGLPSPDLGVTAAATEDALLRCQAETAAALLAGLGVVDANEPVALQARLMVARAFSEGDGDTILTLMRLWDPGLARMATDGVAGESPMVDYVADTQVYRTVPIPPPIGPIFPTPASGLSVWLRDPIAAADIGAPQSGLAQCR